MTSTNTLGIRNGNQIIPYGATTKRTKQVDNSVLAITSAVTGWAVVRAVGIAYADSTGKWRLRINIDGTITSATKTTITIDVTSVAFKTGAVQYFTGGVGGLTGQAQLYCSGGTNIIAVFPSTTTDELFISGDVELNAEPAWAAANMEGAVNASVYIPAADASTTGLITAGAQTVAGVKTFNSGAVINESGADSDTRIEGDTDQNLIFVDASADKVGVGTATPAGKLDIRREETTGTKHLLGMGGSGANPNFQMDARQFLSTSANADTDTGLWVINFAEIYSAVYVQIRGSVAKSNNNPIVLYGDWAVINSGGTVTATAIGTPSGLYAADNTANRCFFLANALGGSASGNFNVTIMVFGGGKNAATLSTSTFTIESF